MVVLFWYDRTGEHREEFAAKEYDALMDRVRMLARNGYRTRVVAS